MSTNIPEARRLLNEVLHWEIEDHVRDQLTAALALMVRTVRPKRRTGQRQMTAALGADARRMHATTRMSQAAIAQALNINTGRVNEAINGMWAS